MMEQYLCRPKSIVFIGALTCLVAAMECGLASAADVPTTKPAASLDAQALFAKASPAVVKIFIRFKTRTVSTGSGFLVDAYGTIVTNYHVIKRIPGVITLGPNGKIKPVVPVGAARREILIKMRQEIAGVRGRNATDRKRELREQYEERLAGRTPIIDNGLAAHVYVQNQPALLVATIVAVDRQADLAVIKVEGSKLPFMKIREAPPKVGEKIYAIGSPEGLTNTLSDGLISGLRSHGKLSLIQISAPISHGSSGGPLISSNGMVVGVTTLIMVRGENLGFAVPAERVSRLAIPFFRDKAIEVTRPRAKEPTSRPKKPSPAKEANARHLLAMATTCIDEGAIDKAQRFLYAIIYKHPHTAVAPKARTINEKLEKQMLANRKARAQLSLATNYINAGLTKKAITILKDLIAKYPKTKAAAEARVKLENKRGQENKRIKGVRTILSPCLERGYSDFVCITVR